MLRDEPFLRCVLLTNLQHEEEQIKKETRDFYAELSSDDNLFSTVHGLSLCSHEGASGTSKGV